MTDIAPRLLPVSTVAKMLGLNRRQIYSSIKRGLVPHVVLAGHTIRIPVGAINDELKNACIGLVETRRQTATLGRRLRDAVLAHPTTDGSRVYFIKVRGFVKVGFSRQLDARAAALGTGMPDEPELLGSLPGGREAEKAAHKALAKYHHKNEWFALTKTVKTAISVACGGQQ